MHSHSQGCQRLALIMMLARPTVSARAVSRKATCNTEIARVPTPVVRRPAVVRASSAPEDASTTLSPSRRAVLLAVPAGALLLQSGLIGPARAEGYKTFLGYSQASCRQNVGIVPVNVPSHALVVLI